MYGRTAGGPEYLFWSLPFWIAAVLLGAYLVFGRGGNGDDGPRLIFATAQVTAIATQTPLPTATSQPPTPLPTQTPLPQPVTYTIQPGDSLTSICASQLPDLDECVSRVVELNGLGGADLIEAGQVLELPAPEGGRSAPSPSP
jgi:LysM repeat protein